MTDNQHTRRAFVLNAASGAFVGLADALVDARVIMAAFLAQLTTSNTLISLLAPMRDAGWFLPQFFVSAWVDRFPRKSKIYRATNIFRLLSWLALIVCTVLLTGTPLLIAFLLCTIPISIGAGIAGLPWMVITSKTIPANRRGALFGWRNGLAALLGIAGGALVGFLLGLPGLAFPYNYAVVFSIAASVFLVGYVLMGLVDDAPDPLKPPAESFIGQFKHAWAMVSVDSQYQLFLAGRISMILGAACTPFFAVIALRELKLDSAWLGTFVSTALASSLAFNTLFSRVGDQRGHKLVMVAATLLGALLTAIGLLLVTVREPALPLIFAAYVTSGALNAALGVSWTPLLMELTPPGERSTYFGFTNTSLGVALLFSGALGVLVDVIGFHGLFIVCGAMFILATTCIARLRNARAEYA